MALCMTGQPFAPLQTSYCSKCTQKHEPLNHNDMNALSAIYKEGSLQGDKSVGKDVDTKDFSPVWQEMTAILINDITKRKGKKEVLEVNRNWMNKT